MDANTINMLVEQRLTAIDQIQDNLIEGWSPFVGAVNQYTLDTQDRELSLAEQRVIAQCLENALIESGLKGRAQLFEATTEDNIAFLGVQLPVIAALLPSLALNESALNEGILKTLGYNTLFLKRKLPVLRIKRVLVNRTHKWAPSFNQLILNLIDGSKPLFNQHIDCISIHCKISKFKLRLTFNCA